MLRFSVYHDGKLADSADLAGAYLVGSDGVPVRAEIEFKDGEIICRKRAAGPAALAILWSIDGGGRMMLETTRLPERDKPYILQLELLRGRLMRLAQKQEDWGLHDFDGTDLIAKHIMQSREHFVEGLKAETPAKTAAIAEKGVGIGLRAAEELATFHAELFLNRRKQVGGFPSQIFGCTIDVASTNKVYPKRLLNAFEYVSIPFTWRDIQPKEGKQNWDHLDRWVDWAVKNRMPIRGSNLVSFTERSTPDWLRIWEHDFDAIRDFVAEHIRRVIDRYGHCVPVWDVICGIHANNCFSFNFEQLMELTRMATVMAKQLAPRSTIVVDLITPWGEYYAGNQRTIPPMLYAEMLVQSGVSFDAFGLHCYCGIGVEGFYVRDLFQISSLLDRFAGLGKPVHLTGVQAPSDVAVDSQDAWGGERSADTGGAWHKEWSEDTQRAWLRRIYHIILSKPFIEAVTWRDLSDCTNHFLPHGGLLRADRSPKPAYDELIAIRKGLIADLPKTASPARK